MSNKNAGSKDPAEVEKNGIDLFKGSAILKKDNRWKGKPRTGGVNLIQPIVLDHKSLIFGTFYRVTIPILTVFPCTEIFDAWEHCFSWQG